MRFDLPITVFLAPVVDQSEVAPDLVHLWQLRSQIQITSENRQEVVNGPLVDEVVELMRISAHHFDRVLRHPFFPSSKEPSDVQGAVHL